MILIDKCQHIADPSLTVKNASTSLTHEIIFKFMSQDHNQKIRQIHHQDKSVMCG
jgi:hypothetical protein